MFATLLGRAFCLLAAGSALGFAVNAARPDGVRFTKFEAPTSCGVGPGHGAAPAIAPVEILAPAAAVGVCGDAQTLVADVRSAAAFAEGHVTGAIHLPCTSSDGAASAAVSLLAGRHTLIVYGEGTEDARVVAEELKRRTDVRIGVIDGGFVAWNRAGLACSSGPCAECAVGPHP